MTNPPPKHPATPSANAFDFRASIHTLPCLLIRQDDADTLDAFLSEQVARLPRFFEQAPVVLDLSQYPGDEPLHSFPTIVGMIRGYGMVPVGVRGASEGLREQARLLELAVMPNLRQRRKNAPAAPPRAAAPEQPAANVGTPLIVDQPVRSGQRIYARGGDLILLAGVSPGAEVMADGHIHAYAPVHGRMLAGVRDNPSARIFCCQFGPELVAIAGCYQVSEDLPQEHIGRRVQISLQADTLDFASI